MRSRSPLGAGRRVCLQARGAVRAVAAVGVRVSRPLIFQKLILMGQIITANVSLKNSYIFQKTHQHLREMRVKAIFTGRRKDWAL